MHVFSKINLYVSIIFVTTTDVSSPARCNLLARLSFFKLSKYSALLLMIPIFKNISENCMFSHFILCSALNEITKHDHPQVNDLIMEQNRKIREH